MKKVNFKGILFFATMFVVFCAVLCGFLNNQNKVYASERFNKITKVNGINIGGLEKSDAKKLIETTILLNKHKIEITLTHQNFFWKILGEDLELDSSIFDIVENIFEKTSSGNFFERMKKNKKLKETNGNVIVSCKQIFSNFQEKIDEIKNQINKEKIEPYAVFQPNEKNVFAYCKGQNGEMVEQEKLFESIDNLLISNFCIKTKIPTVEICQTKTIDNLKNETSLRGSFKTSFKSSSKNRKSNITTALKCFNGKVVLPNEQVSFNETTGKRNEENGYKKANIILNGEYIEGVGGGVCQASTTLYNALLLADVEVLEVHRHTLPASYVSLALDSMVVDGLYDLKFANNTQGNIYIKAWTNENDVFVEIYGIKFDDGFVIKTKSEFVKTLPHGGDTIVQDTNGKYSNKITFKGEYLRVKYPKEGYEAKAYVLKIQDGVLVEEKLVRHEIYFPQNGVIVEGTEDVYQGVTLPINTVQFIPPQKLFETNESNVKEKLENVNPSKFNP